MSMDASPITQVGFEVGEDGVLLGQTPQIQPDRVSSKPDSVPCGALGFEAALCWIVGYPSPVQIQGNSCSTLLGKAENCPGR